MTTVVEPTLRRTLAEFWIFGLGYAGAALSLALVQISVLCHNNSRDPALRRTVAQAVVEYVCGVRRPAWPGVRLA